MKKVSYKILANDQDITSKISDRLVRLSLHDAAGFENDTAEIELDNRDEVLDIPPTGAELSIYIGYENELSYRGIYTVDEIEVPLDLDTMTIKAQAAQMKSSLKAPRDASYDNISFAALANQIAKRHGYESEVNAEIAAVSFVHIDQRGESDINLLTRLAKENNGVFKMAANKLVIVPKSAGKTVSGKSLPTLTINDPENSTGTVTVKDKDDYKSVVAYWFDEGKQEKVIEKAGSGDPQFTIKKTHADQGAAVNAANSKLAELQRGNRTLSLTRPLTPNITPEGSLILENHKKAANYEWLIESCDHVIEPGRAATTSVSCAIKES